MIIDDIRRSISAYLYERTTSPFYGAFIFSWLAWNWEIPLILVADHSGGLSGMLSKIRMIEDMLNLRDALLLPFLYTAVIVGIVPAVANVALRWQLWYKQKSIAIKQKMEKSQLLSVEDSIAIRAEIAKGKTEKEKVLHDKDGEIESLKKDLEKCRAEKAESAKNFHGNVLNLVSDIIQNPELREKCALLDSGKAVKLFMEGGELGRLSNAEQQVLSAIADDPMGCRVIEKKRVGTNTIYQLTDAGREAFRWLRMIPVPSSPLP